MAQDVEQVLLQLIESGQLGEAALALRRELSVSRLDPANEQEWAHIADRIDQGYRARNETRTATEFWEQLEQQFLVELEPRLGPLHKGHIYFRLGIRRLRCGIGDGSEEFRKAYAEDLRRAHSEKSDQAEALENARNKAAYVMLSVLEIVGLPKFKNTDERKTYVEGYFYPAYQAATIKKGVIPTELVDESVQRLLLGAPPQRVVACMGLAREMRAVSDLKLPFAMAVLSGALLEGVVLGEREASGATPRATDRLQRMIENLKELRKVPSDTERALHVVRDFRNRIHPEKEGKAEFKLTYVVATMVLRLLERALHFWAFRKHYELPPLLGGSILPKP